MGMKIETRGRHGSTPSHVRQFKSGSLLRSRTKACVASDRAQIVEELGRGASPCSIKVDVLAERLLLLKIVGQEAHILRKSLQVCQKISAELGIPLRQVSFPGLTIKL